MTLTVSTMQPPFFRSHEVCKLAGVSYRQLDYWDRIGLLSPSRAAEGSGTARGYTPEEVGLVKLVGRLASHGIRVSLTREVIDLVRSTMRDMVAPLDACLVLPYDGPPVLSDQANLMHALGADGGYVLPLASIFDLP